MDVADFDPRLDRIPMFDPASRSFPVSHMLELVGAKSPRAYTWRIEQILDQGAEGACVGYGWAHELLCRPAVAKLVDANALAREIYHEAQKVDPWPGESYSGTSVLAGAKIVQRMGGMKEYRWAFGLDDVTMSIGHLGPVVLGLNWYAAMIETDAAGFIRPEGHMVGGHCIVATGVSFKKKYVTLVNSWGPDWGVHGHCRISFEHLERLLHEQGEACVPLLRQTIKQVKAG